MLFNVIGPILRHCYGVAEVALTAAFGAQEAVKEVRFLSLSLRHPQHSHSLATLSILIRDCYIISRSIIIFQSCLFPSNLSRPMLSVGLSQIIPLVVVLFCNYPVTSSHFYEVVGLPLFSSMVSNFVLSIYPLTPTAGLSLPFSLSKLASSILTYAF